MCLFPFDADKTLGLPLLSAVMNWPSIYFLNYFYYAH